MTAAPWGEVMKIDPENREVAKSEPDRRTPEEIAAIINHERSSWGNQAKQIPVEEVEKIVSFLKAKQPNP